jgi:hypothetical protein
MFSFVIDFILGFIVGRTARNSAIAARNSARLVEMASWSEAQKLAYRQREQYLAGQKRFVFGLLGLILGAAWVAGALFGGN